MPAEQRTKAAQNSKLYALGFDEARSMFGHVLDMQAREDEIALVRDRQRGAGRLLIETWLDDVLSARPADAEQPLDLLHAQPPSRKGLIAYGVDRERLAAAGMGTAEIDRVYRAMYVYSVGFCDMLKVRGPASLPRSLLGSESVCKQPKALALCCRRLCDIASTVTRSCSTYGRCTTP